MSYFKKIICTLVICASGFAAMAQVSIQFVPEVFGRSMDGLMNASIFNVSGKRDVRLRITVTEAKAGKVLVMQTQPFALVPGNNLVPVTAVRSAKIDIAANTVGNYIRRNQYFPIGSYDYEFVVFSASSSEEIIVEQNFTQDLVPPAPLDLIEPYNDDEICEKRPTFTWQPSIPQVPGMQYSLLMVEVKDKQNAVEALNYNLPIVNQRGIVANVLMYPPISKELTVGKKYAWQVTAYKDQTVINRSEVWSFKLNCEDTVANKPEIDNGYRDIEDLAKGNYYIASGWMKFAVINSYEEQALKYSISCLNEPTLKIRSLPKVKLKRGQNKIGIDFSHNSSFKDGNSYVMKVSLPNGSSKSLRFIYREPDEK